ncbi:histidinol-phosphate transaminase [Dyadobacter sp. Leaf189]|uniref:pyridoxal phosphate-dependent aminotransferase n=1 Tax=Dyadobacter sp. Leaf189 TaxID=1736295 RepID=UPI0006F8ADDC|nr:aminotransferase class I/II-fold pyridoxal phosphate-dependent enzyme [Dyadobacter sp. Leaf189]KQS30929.1 class I and II aminotransferase [Dyadobacter sp. Leaf189]
MLSGHGDDGYTFGKDIVADFSTNVWYGGEPAGMKEFVWDKWKEVNRYPEVTAERLSEKIAAHHGLQSGQILVNNGTTESIYLIAQLFSGRATTILTPAFSEYEDACHIFGHELRFLPWSEGLDLPQLRADLVFICNPNNPTGKVFPDLLFWIKRNPGCLFVIDEAFIDFTVGVESAFSLLKTFRNVVILRSLTKTYAIPGLRLGYIAGQEELVSQLRSIKQPWTVNALAQAAGHFIFDNYDKIKPPVEQLLSDKLDFLKQLSANEAIETSESATHFFLCKTLVRSAGHLKQFLLDQHGILIRDAGNFRGLTRQHFRVATLSPEQNSLLVHALEEWKKLYY